MGVSGDQKDPRKTKPYVSSKLAAYVKKLKPSEKTTIEAVVVTRSKQPFGSHNWHCMVGSRGRRAIPIITRRKLPSDAIIYNHKSGSSESEWYQCLRLDHPDHQQPSGQASNRSESSNSCKFEDTPSLFTLHYIQHHRLVT